MSNHEVIKEFEKKHPRFKEMLEMDCNWIRVDFEQYKFALYKAHKIDWKALHCYSLPKLNPIKLYA